LGELFADAALSASRQFRVPLSRVALIGSHGQTIFHHGRPIPYFGSPIASTLQIGEPSVIAARTGINTVGDFRPRTSRSAARARRSFRMPTIFCIATRN